MGKKINIAEILKDKSKGTKLYSPLFGDVYLLSVEAGIIRVEHHKKNETIATFFRNGKYYSYPESELLLFPSKEMHDWSKIVWKKGDILVNNERNAHVVFKGFQDDTYRTFMGNYYFEHIDNPHYSFLEKIYETKDFGIEIDSDAKTYIKFLEKRLGGKLNLETLEIEKPAPKDGDILCVIDNSNDYHYILIYKGQDDKHIHRYVTMFEDNSLNIKKDSYLTKPKDYSMRYATDKEKQQLFDALAKENKTWDSEHKMVVDLKPRWTPKPFDRVITKVDDDAIWTANIFSHIDQYGEYVTIGCESGYSYCLPYNEETAKLIGTTKDVEG